MEQVKDFYSDCNYNFRYFCFDKLFTIQGYFKKPSLSGIFSDSLEQSYDNLTSITNEKYLNFSLLTVMESMV